MSDELIGTDLGGRFRVEEKIADAMLGRVYSARSLEDGRLYHVKIPYANVSGSAEKSERFRRELEAMSKIDTVHTVKVVDTGIHDSIAFLVMEYLAATPLAAALEKGPMSPHRVAGIVAQIASACEAAHSVGIVHRNLSPQTVLLLDNAYDRDFVKVTDFGLSRFVDADAEEANGVLTQAGTRIGNVLYMAPEYIEQDEVGPPGDLYALGALAYHMLTGNPPFTGKAADVLTRHVTDDVPRPSLARPGLPGWCDSLVTSLMSKKPEKRPEARQVVAALEQEFGPLRAPKLLGIDAEGKVKRNSRAPLIIAAVGTGVLALGVALFGIVVTIGAGIWLVTRAPEMIVPPSGDLAPLPGAALPGEAVAPATPTPAPSAPVPAGRTGPTAPTPAIAPATPVAPAPASAEPAAPAAPAPRTATLRVRANQRALVHLDDVPVGYTPIDVEIASGPHVVAALIPTRATSRQQRQIQATAGQPVSIDFSF